MVAGGPVDVGLHGFELPCPVKTGSDLRGMMDMTVTVTYILVGAAPGC